MFVAQRIKKLFSSVRSGMCYLRDIPLLTEL
jgi:hypothetical protein